MTNEELNARLYEKMCAEQEKFKEELLGLPAEEILERSYAYNIREDILLIMEETDLTEKQCLALLGSEHPLEDIFERRENNESRYMDELCDHIECRANDVIREEFLKSQKDAR